MPGDVAHARCRTAFTTATGATWSIDLIAEIQTRGLWSSPKGKTPEASLYAAMIREISAKGKDARFAKQDKGLFIANAPASA